MLSLIIAVTLTVSDISVVENAYVEFLGYTVAERGKLSRELAVLWQTPGLEGNDYVLLQPESGEPVFLRVIQQEPTAGYAAMKTWGWNANEILVQDTYAIHERLKDSPFEVVGEPMSLSVNPAIIAMQALGPADELIYLTRIPEGESGFNLGSAKSFVDRTFIVVAGGPDLAAMGAFYRDQLGMPVTDPMPSTISVLAEAYGMPSDHQFQLAIVNFEQDFLIEIDQYPDESVARPQRTGELPPGIAMVSFSIADLDQAQVDFLVPPARIAEAPYLGSRVAVTIGAAGELIELIEQ
jgi:catechol 2,3-dioxygenase-like lactoylglutathione lyase family enzyme